MLSDTRIMGEVPSEIFNKALDDNWLYLANGELPELVNNAADLCEYLYCDEFIYCYNCPLNEYGFKCNEQWFNYSRIIDKYLRKGLTFAQAVAQPDAMRVADKMCDRIIQRCLY